MSELLKAVEKFEQRVGEQGQKIAALTRRVTACEQHDNVIKDLASRIEDLERGVSDVPEAPYRRMLRAIEKLEALTQEV